MMIAKVIDKLVSTRKCESLQGIKLLAVEECVEKGVFAAGDQLGAGIGEYVLISCGDTAMLAAGKEIPIDAMVIGIIDSKPDFIKEE